MGQKAATNEVINGLVNALLSADHEVRRSAGAALVEINEKVSTSEVINALVNTLRSTNDNVISRCMYRPSVEWVKKQPPPK